MPEGQLSYDSRKLLLQTLATLSFLACLLPNFQQDVAGMRKFRIDQDFLIEHWHMIYIMPVVFAEIYF